MPLGCAQIHDPGGESTLQPEMETVPADGGASTEPDHHHEGAATTVGSGSVAAV